MDPQIPGIGILKELQSMDQLGSVLMDAHPVLSGVFVLLAGGALIFLFCFLIGRGSGESPTEQPNAQPRQPIGYKYANISRSGKFLGLSRGKPYWLDSTTSDKSMGFHSYKSIELLQRNTYRDGYSHRGALILEVLHYGDVTEYEDGYVSTGQRVLQVASGDGLCWAEGPSRQFCTNEVEFVYILGRKTSLRLCRPHYAGMGHLLNLIPGRKRIHIQRWLKELSKDPQAQTVRVAETIRSMELSQ